MAGGASIGKTGPMVKGSETDRVSAIYPPEAKLKPAGTAASPHTTHVGLPILGGGAMPEPPGEKERVDSEDAD
jgi:hypothetical protein